METEDILSQLKKVNSQKDKYIFRVKRVNDPQNATMPKVFVPNSVSIPAIDEILVKDPETDIYTPVQIMYSSREKTIIRDEQNPNTMPTLIDIGDKGYIELDPRRDAMKIQYLLNCNYNASNDKRDSSRKPIFIEVKLDEAIDTYLEESRYASKAEAYVYEMSPEDLVNYSIVTGTSKNKSISEIRFNVVSIARRDPHRFFENINSPEYEVTVNVSRAINERILLLKDNKLILQASNLAILSIPSGVEPLREAANYFLSQRGKEHWEFVMNKLRMIEEDKKALQDSYTAKKAIATPSKDAVTEMSFGDLFEKAKETKVITWKAPYFYFDEEVLGKSAKDACLKIESDEKLQNLLKAAVVSSLK